MNDIGERRAAISGIGQSQVGRRLGRDAVDLTLDACLEAIADAGLDRRDIDGMATYPGGWFGPSGFSGPGIPELQDALRLNLSWYTGGPEQPGQLGSVIEAITAVACGLANHVLCFRTVWESTAQGGGGRKGIGAAGGGGKGFRASGIMQWTLPSRRRLGRGVDRDVRPAPHARVRHHARAARADRAQRPPQRGAESEGGVPRCRCRSTTISPRA